MGTIPKEAPPYVTVRLTLSPAITLVDGVVSAAVSVTGFTTTRLMRLFAPIYRFPMESAEAAYGEFNIAAVALAPSPLYPAEPSPATVLITVLLRLISRIALLPLSANNRLPMASE